MPGISRCGKLGEILKKTRKSGQRWEKFTCFHKFLKLITTTRRRVMTKRIAFTFERVEIRNNINMVGRAKVMLNKKIETGRTGVWGISVGVITLIGNAWRILQHAPS